MPVPLFCSVFIPFCSYVTTCKQSCGQVSLDVSAHTPLLSDYISDFIAMKILDPHPERTNILPTILLICLVYASSSMHMSIYYTS